MILTCVYVTALPLPDIIWHCYRSLWGEKRERNHFSVERMWNISFNQQVAVLHKTSSPRKEPRLHELKQPTDVSNLDRCHYPSSWVARYENIPFKLHLLFDESPTFHFHSHISCSLHLPRVLSHPLPRLIIPLSLSSPLSCPFSPVSRLIMASSSQSFCLYELTGDCVLADRVAVIHLDRLAANCVNSH